MEDSLELKVSFDDLQKYLEVHETYIATYVKQEKEGSLSRIELEK
jgi:hypothetical protein